MRRTKAMAAVVGLFSALLIVLAPSASAQTGYPPGACTGLTGTQDVGSVSVGQRFVLQVAPSCVFDPGSPVTVTVNGVEIPGKTSETGGAVLIDIAVLSATQLSVDDPVLVPAVCGVNTVTVTGPSAAAGGQIVTQTATFTVNCATTTGGTTTGTGTGRTPATGRLSLTGGNFLRWTAVALVLMAAGSMFVLADRRRQRVRDEKVAG